MVRTVCAFAVASLLFCSSVRAQLAPGGGRSWVKATLIADTNVVVPGNPFTLGVLLDISPGWHVYWINPGDSGMPTRIDWKLPPGLTAGTTRFPLPVSFAQPGDIVGYGYKNQVLLTTVVTPAGDLAPGAKLDLAASVTWLVCNDVCVPGKAKLSLPVVVGKTRRPSDADRFSAVERQLPEDVSKSARARLTGSKFDPAASVTTLHLQFDEKLAVRSVEVFPGPGDGVEIRGTQAGHDANDWTLRLPVKFESGANASAKVDALVVYTTDSGDRYGVNVEVPVK